MLRLISVASKFAIASDLSWRKYLDHCEVVAQVGRTQRALNGPNSGGSCLHRFSRGMPFSESPIELGFLGNQAGAERDRFGLHRFKEVLGLVSLLIGELKSVGEFENMRRAGIPIEFGHKCQTHPATRGKIGNLLVGERFHRPLLKAGIGRMVAR